MPAPKGNKFAVGNKGTEKMFKTPEDLQKKIDEYFRICDDNIAEVYDKKTQEIKTVADPIPYTVEGLCNVLDCNRATLLNYSKEPGYEDYFNIIEKAKLKVTQNKVEKTLSGKYNATFAIFDLVNNTDYKNTNTTEIVGSGGKDLLNINVSDDTIEKLIEKL